MASLRFEGRKRTADHGNSSYHPGRRNAESGERHAPGRRDRLSIRKADCRNSGKCRRSFDSPLACEPHYKTGLVETVPANIGIFEEKECVVWVCEGGWRMIKKN